MYINYFKLSVLFKVSFAIHNLLGFLRWTVLSIFSPTQFPHTDADDSNGKASYKEDVKLEDKLALEAEEEKKVTNSDNYDDYSASEAAAGVDKSSVETSPGGAAGSAANVSPKDQASQEMQVRYSIFFLCSLVIDFYI